MALAETRTKSVEQIQKRVDRKRTPRERTLNDSTFSGPGLC